MSKPILMPQVGQDLEEGKLVEWKVAVGDTVAKGDIVAVVESEKASFEVEAFESGTVLDLLYKEGDTTKVLAPLMYVGNAEDKAASEKPAQVAETKQEAAQPVQAKEPALVGASQADGPAAAVDEAARVESEIPAPPPSAKAGRSSPLARRFASMTGIDLLSLTGSGPRGAVVKRDIDKALKGLEGKTPRIDARQSTDSPASREPASRPQGQAGTLHRTWLRKGQGDPVVMIHGFGADLNAWRVLVAAANLARPVLAVDLPGHGKSQGSASTIQEMVAAVAATLEQEGIEAADLVGHSLGAAVAAILAEQARFTVRSLFLISPGGLGPDINGEFIRGYCRSRSEASLAPWMALLVTDPSVIGPAFVRITAETRAQAGVAEAQEQVADALFPDGTQAFSIRDALEKMAVPVRVVFGGADRIIPARHTAGLPGTVALHTFPHVGHMPQIEAREPVARLLAEHLRAVG